MSAKLEKLRLLNQSRNIPYTSIKNLELNLNYFIIKAIIAKFTYKNEDLTRVRLTLQHPHNKNLMAVTVGDEYNEIFDADMCEELSAGMWKGTLNYQGMAGRKFLYTIELEPSAKRVRVVGNFSSKSDFFYLFGDELMCFIMFRQRLNQLTTGKM